MSVEIIPAILPEDWDELNERIDLVKGLAKSVQIDICDGQFVPNATWPYKKSDVSFGRILHEEIGLPDWETLDYEFDLMVNDPEEVVGDWIKAGASRLVIHLESRGHLRRALDIMRGRVEVVLALNEDTPISKIGDPALAINEGDVQSIQLMGIDRIGFQGQEFDDRVIDKIKEIKKMCPDYPISIDGGVSLINAHRLIEAGADRLVVGSAIFDSDNPIESLTRFQSL